ncbi:kinesin-like protein CG14535 isoform X1 [Macrosteles quadrilineatus]|uniref:kinesin-like protein CG14535 isoform X1 n=1 Tax=Macrosteles quadrilineatus TaxID=74068 RepID=UPI0023E0DA0B|nr:kinesin-like protein CG14535 isoform X1 [Macrosteles quadrilineatus]
MSQCHSHGHRRRRLEEEPPGAPGGFCGALVRAPPPIPPALLRRIGGKDITGVGKVKVMLKVAGSSEDTASFKVDRRHKQVTLTDPAPAASHTPEAQDRRVAVAAPKMFAFDAIFTEDDNQMDVTSTALVDILHAVINGSDGCLLCFGHSKLGKSQTMIGSPDALGVIPCAISWLFRGINEQKLKTGARFSVRVSAVEVSTGMKDLLIGHADDCEQSPGVYLREEVQNYSELRVPSADKAAYYLDSALSARSAHAHFLFTLHIYQYNVASKGAVAGGRSRLHLLDLGASDRSKPSSGLSLSAIGNVLLAIFNGNRHPPHREHKLTQVLRDCLSSLTCHVTLLTHVSPSSQNYAETLGTVQLAARIHRIRRRRVKFGNSTATQVAGEDIGRTTGSSDVDPSSSEQSADTVIYVGRSEETDGEHPPVYLPSLTSGDNRCAMGKALRGSGMEHRESPSQSPRDNRSVLSVKQSSTKSSSLPCSPQKVPGDSSSGVEKSKSSLYGKIGTNSAKSSPAKTTSHKDSKHEAKQMEERWVDGPKIPRSKVVEARQLNLLHKSRQHLLSKKETWVDGPLKSNQDMGYGFMDYHKKSMIKKWLESQSLLHHRHKSSCGKEKGSRSYLTRFKTCGAERRTEAEGKSKSSSSGSREEPYRPTKGGPLTDEAYERFMASRGQASGQEDGDEEVKVVPPLTQTTVVQQNGDLSRVVPVQRIQETQSAEEEEDDDIEVEIVEVEESEESVLMQDSCLQVTEEDIALCMGQLENPLPEVDQSKDPNRPQCQPPIHILLSTSTFKDSTTYDFDRLVNQRMQNFSEGSPRFINRNRAPLLPNNRGVVDYTQLSRLSMSGALDPTCRELENRPLARCQSLSLTNMLDGCPGTEQLSDYDNNSIVSEPAYIMGGDQMSDKLCDKCKLRFNSGDLYETPLYANLKTLSALRHPDGASNPNLKGVGEKDKGEGEKENLTPKNKEEDSDEDPAVPPPLHSTLLTLTRDTFRSSKCGGLGVGLSGGGGSCQSQFSVHDPGGTGMQYCKADVERLERGWSESQRLRDPRTPLLTPNSRWHSERESRGTPTLVRLKEYPRIAPDIHPDPHSDK